MIKNILVAAFYFVLSSLITWWFIDEGKLLYLSQKTMVLSCAIASGKWGIQIAAALFFLNEKKWEFIRQIGFVCFVGSCILIPYCVFVFIKQLYVSFAFSLIFSVLVMIIMYYKAVVKTRVGLKWFWCWLLCLAIAISLQLLVIFKMLGQNNV